MPVLNAGQNRRRLLRQPVILVRSSLDGTITPTTGTVAPRVAKTGQEADQWSIRLPPRRLPERLNAQTHGAGDGTGACATFMAGKKIAEARCAGSREVFLVEPIGECPLTEFKIAMHPQREASNHVRQPAPLLQVKNLRIEFPTRRGTLVAVDDISLRPSRPAKCWAWSANPVPANR